MREFNKIETSIINRIVDAVSIIRKSNIKCIEYGIFGSVARNDYNALSDLDIVMICYELPDKTLIANLRDELDDINCDLAVVLKDNFDEPKTAFHKAVKRDYRRIEYYG